MVTCMLTSDAAVIGRVRAGDPDAFSLLVDRYHERCARLAMRLLGDSDDAADAVQDAFIRAYNSLDRYQERDRFSSWLMCIVANRCRSATETSRRRADVAGEWWHAQVEPESSCGETFSGIMTPERDHALAERLSVALAQLRPETRTAVVRKYAEDMSYEEMAAATGVGISALKMRVARGSAQLRRVLAGAGVVVVTVMLIFEAHKPRDVENSPVTAVSTVACDTLRSLIRDTLSQGVRDTLLPAARCTADSSVLEPRRTRTRPARIFQIFHKRGL